MRLDRSELSKAVQTALSLGAVAAVGVAGTAFAQNAATTPNNQKQPQTLQTIVVTGSHIRRVDLETSNPVVAVTAQQIAATGALTLGDVVQQLPVITGGVQTPVVNNGGGSGSTLVGLRGLGASRTLVLVDGQRPIKNLNGGVDLNTIPTAAVERIEVLTSGASAIYGSDAIGGVINIILKSNYQGAQFQANYGISDHNDAERKGASFMFGQTSDKGSILAGVSYQQFGDVLQSARKYSQNAITWSTSSGFLNLINGKPFMTIAGSSNAARDFINLGKALNTKFGCSSGGPLSLNVSAWVPGNSPTKNGDYHCFSHSDEYNFAAVNLLMTPQERTNGFFKGVYHLTDNVDFYATVLHNKTSSGFQLAPAVFGTDTRPGVLISKNNFYNPFGVNFGTTGASYRSRLYAGGNRAANIGTTTDDAMFGFKGNFNIFDQNWTWDLGEDYGHISTIRNILGLPNAAQLQKDLATPSMMINGVVTCVGTAGNPATAIPLSQCTPFDPFNLNSPSAQSVISGSTVAALEDFWNIQRIYHFDASGGLFQLPAGTVQLAFGGDYRKEYQNNVISSQLESLPSQNFTCALGSQCSAHTQGGYNVKEAYAELYIPILKDMPFVHALSVDLGERYSKYSDFGSTNNWKIGVEYRPIQDLLVRGTVSRIFRAPTIGDIFSPPVSSAPFLASDPCTFSGAGPNPNAGNPACVGVPAIGPFVNDNIATKTQITAVNSGSKFVNFPLGPEKGKSYDFGVVYSPHFVPGLTVQADTWRIYLNNVITTIGVQTVLNQCFAGQLVFCPLITRIKSGPTAGQINFMVQPTGNLGRIDVKGTDLAGHYQLPAFSFGQFTVDLHATYLDQYKIETAPGLAGNEVFNAAGTMGWFGSAEQAACPFSAGGMCFFPHWRARLTAGWRLGPWDAQWTMNYTGPFSMAQPQLQLANGNTKLKDINQFGSWIYNDLTVGYMIRPINARIDVGVNNVFDKQPPVFGFARSLNANTSPEDFDPIGRYYWGRITVNF